VSGDDFLLALRRERELYADEQARAASLGLVAYVEDAQKRSLDELNHIGAPQPTPRPLARTARPQYGPIPEMAAKLKGLVDDARRAREPKR
jgi:hypothetical protein